MLQVLTNTTLVQDGPTSIKQVLLVFTGTVLVPLALQVQVLQVTTLLQEIITNVVQVP